jgi:hypothetical protein
MPPWRARPSAASARRPMALRTSSRRLPSASTSVASARPAGVVSSSPSSWLICCDSRTSSSTCFSCSGSDSSQCCNTQQKLVKKSVKNRELGLGVKNKQLHVIVGKSFLFRLKCIDHPGIIYYIKRERESAAQNLGLNFFAGAAAL